MKYSLVTDLVVITNSFIYKFLTVEESVLIEELNQELLKVKTRHDLLRDKLIRDYGGIADERGIYRGIKNQSELSRKLIEYNEREIPFTKDTNLLSPGSIDDSIREIPFNTIQVRLIKEHLLKKPKETEPKEKKTNKNNAKKS